MTVLKVHARCYRNECDPSCMNYEYEGKTHRCRHEGEPRQDEHSAGVRMCNDKLTIIERGGRAGLLYTDATSQSVVAVSHALAVPRL